MLSLLLLLLLLKASREPGYDDKSTCRQRTTRTIEMTKCGITQTPRRLAKAEKRWNEIVFGGTDTNAASIRISSNKTNE